MYVVTGGAGFIGANIIKTLNERNINNVLVVDNLEKAEKFRNLLDCKIADYLDKRDFLEEIKADAFGDTLNAVFHEGACSDTMEYNGLYMMENNYEYSKKLLHFCQERRVPFLYASSAAVYGVGKIFHEQREHEAPLNVYGYSKFLFDEYVRRILPKKTAQIVGLRYFNVYGDQEQHKGRMASVAFHFFNQFRESGRVKLFEGSDGYDNGEQRRDFVSVEDAVAVNLFFLDHPAKSGIFNIGTGRSQTFNDVAVTTINSLRKNDGEPALKLGQMQKQGIIEYCDFPPMLEGRYQSFTEADISALRAVGYEKDFFTVEQGVSRYIARLLEKPPDSEPKHRRM